MEDNQELEFMSKKTIKEGEKNFTSFMKIPEVIAWIYGIFIFIIGIATITTGIGIFVWIIGGVLVGLTYWILKMCIAYQVLLVGYLKEIKDKLNKEE